jgi:pimeloyl-ACP methyl ester carboxylesterase
MSDSTSWWEVGPLLAQAGWDVTAVDLPGHGDGPRLRQPVESIAQVARDTISRLPERLTVLVGHSLGAVVAAAIGVEDADLSAGIVLVEPVSREGLDLSLFADGVEAEAESARNDPGTLRQRLRNDHPRWDDAQVDRVVSARAAADGAAIANALRAQFHWDLAELVDAIPLPVLVIAVPETPTPFVLGGGSALTGPERQRLAAAVPEERFVVVEGGHSVQRDHPDRVAELILHFANELRSRDTLPDPEGFVDL